jgi:AraC-like DNA-binding protein
MTASLTVSAISTEVTHSVTHRIGLLLDRHRCDKAIRYFAPCDAGFGAVGGPAKPVTSLLGFTNMLEVAAEASGLSHLGLDMARVQHTQQSGGGLRGLFVHASSVGQALEDFIRFFPLIQTGTAVRLERQGATARFVYSVQDRSISNNLQDSAYTLGKLHLILRMVAGEAWCLDRVSIAMRPPKSSHRYTDFFQAPVSFNGAATALYFPAAALALPIATADPHLYASLCEDLRRKLDYRDDLNLLEEALRAWMMHAGHRADSATLEHAAADFGVTPRTMQRRLKELGISFLDLRAQMRMELARRLLAGSPLSVTSIAVQLGFSETSAFTRAFRSHAQQSPRAFRQAAGVPA